MNANEFVWNGLDTSLAVVEEASREPIRFTVHPLASTNCDCPDCRAGKHLYELCRWRDGEWKVVGWSLQGYENAEQARVHNWGIVFEPGDTWEDGSPIPPTEPPPPRSGHVEMVPLDTDALRTSADALRKHCGESGNTQRVIPTLLDGDGDLPQGAKSMSPRELVRELLHDQQDAVLEVSLRLPNRGTRWLATWTGPDGLPRTKSTQLQDRAAALDLAKEWEAADRVERANRREQNSAGFAYQHGRKHAALTHAEIAAILRLSERAVRGIERRALHKLRQHPLLREVWAELTDGLRENEDVVDFAPDELAALWGLVRTHFERLALLKVLVILWADS